MKEERIQVIGVGSPVIDFVSDVEEETIERIRGEKGGMELVDRNLLRDVLSLAGEKPVKTAGGSAGNTIFALTRLGMDCAFIGKIGNDRNGRYYQTLFRQIGGDCSRFKIDNTEPTACCVSLVTPDSERTMRTCLGAAERLSPDEIGASDFAGCRHVHVEGYLLFNRDLVGSILRNAKEVGCTVSIDLGSFEVVEAAQNFLPGILSDFADFVFANEDEAAAYTGMDDPRQSLEVLGRCCKVAAVKVGEKGAWLREENRTVHVPAVPTENLRDTTGAGDYWAAGFLYGHLNGHPLSRSGAVASLMGRHAIEHRGAVLPERAWNRILSETASILETEEREEDANA